MITIKVVDREGKESEIQGPTDMNLNLMELLKAHEMDVEGTCGGMALCASCHCYITNMHDVLPEKSEDEEDMLDEAFHVDDEKSRLSCQITLKDELDGLEIALAPVG